MIFGRQTPSPYEVRFWQNVDTSGGVLACWPWQRHRNSDGYGHFYDHNGFIFAHRAAYTYTYGLLPRHLFVRHRCDNPSCCNPNHHVLGTGAENRADCVRRGRQAKGESMALAKLTDQKVFRARMKYATCSDMTMGQLAKENGVSQSVMHKAVSGGAWRHVGGPVYHPNREEHCGHPRAVCDAAAREVWNYYHTRNVTQQDLIERFHLSKGTASNIVNAKGAYSFLAKEAA